MESKQQKNHPKADGEFLVKRLGRIGYIKDNEITPILLNLDKEFYEHEYRLLVHLMRKYLKKSLRTV